MSLPKYDKIILFDGVCNLCSGTVKFIIKRDKNAIFKFSSLQSDFSQNLLENFNLSKTNFDTFIYISHNKYLIKSEAVFEIIREFGGFWKTLLIFKLLPTFITDWLYNIISKYRYKVFGKKKSCMIPSEGISKRFIS